MVIEFDIRDWSACAPGLIARQSWLDWGRDPWLPAGSESPPLAAMSPMLRRRTGDLGPFALNPVYSCDVARHVPMVFASRHGEVGRAWQLLEQLAAGEPLSPMLFTLAVHNAIGALYSIDRGHTTNIQALAAEHETVEAGLVEAAGLLADGHDEVLLVHYDAPLPHAYQNFAGEPACFYAWAWRIGRPADAGVRFSLSRERASAQAEPAPSALPHGLDVLQFMLGGSSRLVHRGPRANWVWRRHGRAD